MRRFAAITRGRPVLVAVPLVLASAFAGGDAARAALGQAKEILIPLVTFDDPASIRGWVADPWGKGTAVLTMEQDGDATSCLKMEWEKSASLSNPSLVRGLSEQWKKKYRVSEFYFRYRGDFAGSWLYFYYQTKHDGKYCSFIRQVMGSNDRQWRVQRIPLGGDPEPADHGRDFDIAELDTFCLSCRGRGSLRISEIGIVVKYTTLDAAVSSAGSGAVCLPEATGPIVIDGAIDEEAWNAAKAIELHLADETDPRGLCDSRSTPREKTEAFLAWSKSGLYGAARCFKNGMSDLEADYRDNDPDVHTDECIEIYIDPNRAGILSPEMRKFAVNANGKFGVLCFKRGDDYDGFATAARRLDDRWEMEFFVPWEVIGMTPQDADFLGFNMTRQTWGRAPERSGWSTIRWNGIVDFRTLVLAPAGAEGKRFGAEIDLGFVSPGNYLLYSAGTGGKDLLYYAKLFEKNKLIVQGTGGSGREVLCESLTNERLGSAKGYTIRAAIYDRNDGAVAFLEAELMDGATGTQAALSCSSVALFPVPKAFALAKGATQLGDGTEVACASRGLEYCVARLSKELRAFYGVELADAANVNDAAIVIGLADDLKDVLKRYGLERDVERVKHDGFLLWVGDDQIVATAKEKRGVLYATDALIALTKMSSPETGPAQVRHLKVVDWPQFGLRPWMVSLNGWWPRRRYDVALYQRMIATFPLAFRYNIFTFMLDDYYLWPSVPGHRNPFAWSPDEFSNVADFVNRNLCPVIPHVSSLTHMGEFLDRVKPLRHLVERGDGFYDHRLCTRHPDTYPALFGQYDDMLRVCGRNKEYDSDYFHIQCDELSFKGPPCPRCAGIPRAKLIGDHLKRIAEYLQRKGKRPVMWSDMFVESRPDSMSALRDRLPKQIVLTGWDPTRDDPEIPKLTRNGNEVWKVMTGYRGVGRLNDHRVKARGMLVAHYHWWLSFARNLYTGAPYGPMAQALIANAAWNDFPDNDNSSWSEYCRVYGKWLMHNWSRTPLPGAGSGFVELDISTIANEPVTDGAAGDGKGWFDEGPDRDLSLMDFSAKRIDGIPTRFVRKRNAPRCAMFPAGRTGFCEIRVGRKLGSLILLHTAHLPPQNAIELQRILERDPEQGLELVVFTVHYADGSRASFTANYGWNVLNWRISPVCYNGKKLYHSRYATFPGTFSKYLPDARAFWEGHTGEALRREYPPDIAIHQYEWPNPSPEKEIEVIEIKSLGVPNISYALLAVTGRTVRDGIVARD